MFADSVCESSWADRARRARASVVSFALQALAVSGLLLLPLFYSQTIPQLQFMSALVAPAPPPPPAPVPAASKLQQYLPLMLVLNVFALLVVVLIVIFLLQHR